jgi:hypothetical protein
MAQIVFIHLCKKKTVKFIQKLGNILEFAEYSNEAGKITRKEDYMKNLWSNKRKEKPVNKTKWVDTRYNEGQRF